MLTLLCQFACRFGRVCIIGLFKMRLQPLCLSNSSTLFPKPVSWFQRKPTSEFQKKSNQIPKEIQPLNHGGVPNYAKLKIVKSSGKQEFFPT